MQILQLRASRTQPIITALWLVLCTLALCYCFAGNVWACVSFIVLALVVGWLGLAVEGRNTALLVYLRDSGFYALNPTEHVDTILPERFPELRAVRRFLSLVELRSETQTLLLWPDQFDSDSRRLLAIWLGTCAHRLNAKKHASTQ
jgi:hypothetical protein